MKKVERKERRRIAENAELVAAVAVYKMKKDENEHGLKLAEAVRTFWNRRTDEGYEVPRGTTHIDFDGAFRILEATIRLYMEQEGMSWNSIFIRNDGQHPFGPYVAELKVGWSSDGASTEVRAFSKALAFAADLLDASELSGCVVAD